MRVCIWGTGEGKDILFDCKKSTLRIENFLDNNSLLWNNEIDDISVISPSEIDRTIDYVIISVKYYYQIYAQLIGLGVEREKIIPFFSLNAIKCSFFRKNFYCRRWLYKVISYQVKRYKNDWKRLLNPSWRKHFKAQCKFYEDQGETFVRFDYALNKDSVVFDLGGYQGDFTKGIVDRFDCYVSVFEPVFEYAEKITKMFADNEKVKVYAFGLEDKDSQEVLYQDSDGSSVYQKKDASNNITIEFRNFSNFIKENDIQNIDLMKVNIEGGEYALLEHLIKSGEIKLVDNLQVQFHNISKIHARKRQKAICRELEKTHELTWAYRPFIFDNWKRKKTVEI